MGTVYAKENVPEPTNVDAIDDKGKSLRLSGVSARIERVHIDGLRRTKDDVVVESVQELFHSTDFAEVITNANRVRSRLEALGCFKHVDIFIDTSSGQEALPDGLEVTFSVKEHGRLKGSLSAVGGDNEGSVVVGVHAPNLLGRGERAQFETSFKLSSCNNLHLSLAKPLRTSYNALLSASLHQQRGDFPMSGYRLVDRAFILDLAFNTRDTVKHNLQYEASWREIAQASKNNPIVVRNEYGHTLKSAVRHILTIDRRDSPIFPTTGALLRISNELAGLGGDIAFHKHDATLEWAIPIPFGGAVLVTRGQAGLLQPTQGNLPNGGYNLADKFYLGGPTSVRGFHMRGVGPRPEGMSTGANMFWAAGLHLYSPLPFRPGRTTIGELFRVHAFTTLGQCDDFDPNRLEDLVKNYRASWGVGLAMRIGHIAQLELNYVLPFMFRASDSISPGIQFGLGVQFL